jgi:hypothetical protein
MTPRCPSARRRLRAALICTLATPACTDETAPAGPTSGVDGATTAADTAAPDERRPTSDPEPTGSFTTSDASDAFTADPGGTGDTTTDDPQAQTDAALRRELEAADLSVIHEVVDFAEQPPAVSPVEPDAGLQKWQEIATDLQYQTLYAALVGSGADEATLVAALQSAAYYGSGAPEDPVRQEWAQLRNSLIDDARAVMQAFDLYEQQHGVHVDRTYLEEKTRLPSIAGWEKED